MRPLPAPEIGGLNPTNAKLTIYVSCIEETKIKKKRKLHKLRVSIYWGSKMLPFSLFI